MTLYSDYFLDTNKGYRKYFEVNSIVDWYLINEIAKNIDAAMQTSCYLYFRRGGKVKFGPIWDFDVAFGNYVHGNPEVNDSVNRPDGFCIKNARWFERFFLDPQFVKSVKRRFSDYYDNRQKIYDYLDLRASFVIEEIYHDNMVWGKVCDIYADEEKVKTVYKEKVDFLKNWLEDRFLWLKNNMGSL